MTGDFALFLQGFKGAIDIAKGLKSTYDQHTVSDAQAEFFEKLSDLYVRATSLYESHSTLTREKDELEKKLMEYEQWAQTERQYELKQVAPGKFVRSYKKSDKNTDPMHWLCPNCWEDKKKSILQGHPSLGDALEYICPRCNKFGVRAGKFIPE